MMTKTNSTHANKVAADTWRWLYLTCRSSIAMETAVREMGEPEFLQKSAQLWHERGETGYMNGMWEVMREVASA